MSKALVIFGVILLIIGLFAISSGLLGIFLMICGIVLIIVGAKGDTHESPVYYPSRPPMNPAERDEWSTCNICGVEVKTKNLEKHIFKHTKQPKQPKKVPKKLTSFFRKQPIKVFREPPVICHNCNGRGWYMKPCPGCGKKTQICPECGNIGKVGGCRTCGRFIPPPPSYGYGGPGWPP